MYLFLMSGQKLTVGQLEKSNIKLTETDEIMSTRTENGIVELNVPLDTLQVISETVLRVT